VAIDAFPYGSKLNLTATFQNSQTKAIINPNNVRVRIVGPRGAPYYAYVFGIDPEIVKVSEGVFRATVVCNKEGPWNYRFECWGTYVGGQDRAFAIRDSVFYP
jgi:hypothetical protein